MGGCGPVRVLIVLVAIGAGSGAYAQDLAAGKSGVELFAQNCTICHQSARGLIKTAHAFSLNSFLRQHYTTNARSANAIAAYLRGVENDPRSARGRAGPGEDRKSSRRNAESPASDERERQSPPRESKSSKKRPESSTATRSDEPSVQRGQARPRRETSPPATAARTPEPSATAAPTPEPPAAINVPAASPPTSDHVATWNPAMEALLPAPVEPAAPSGLEPGKPVNQPAFSSPLP